MAVAPEGIAVLIVTAAVVEVIDLDDAIQSKPVVFVADSRHGGRTVVQIAKLFLNIAAEEAGVILQASIPGFEVGANDFSGHELVNQQIEMFKSNGGIFNGFAIILHGTFSFKLNHKDSIINDIKKLNNTQNNTKVLF